MRILITEDDTLTRKILLKSFQKNGFDVITAKIAKEAISKLKDNRIDLILIDIYMPGIDGIDLIGIIRTELKINIPIAVLTRDKSEEMVVKAFEAGADDFILKPFDEVDLLDRLTKLTAKND